MAEVADGAGACCALFCCMGFAGWCGTHTFGGGERGRKIGCGSCCSRSLDDDEFDAAVKKDMERTRDPSIPMAASEPMIAMPPSNQKP
ncbi:hypothetical protein CYLTODRAFT_427109 [Cylindrobasidium torrendii FP15055 ss-10]|uniref:Uncharacterized protein n=1 Tax=Cylindrobasidium torrendii FP15055 ss-10 TaxID=1314674 RepID=A0A0D7AY47_9AGAR|nr:hypothetical protein CYLTODRAFT_427109 [Cylindrobasidium torrendii FP15055 ss-10]